MIPERIVNTMAANLYLTAKEATLSEFIICFKDALILIADDIFRAEEKKQRVR